MKKKKLTIKIKKLNQVTVKRKRTIDLSGNVSIRFEPNEKVMISTTNGLTFYAGAKFIGTAVITGPCTVSFKNGYNDHASVLFVKLL